MPCRASSRIRKSSAFSSSKLLPAPGPSRRPLVISSFFLRVTRWGLQHLVVLGHVPGQHTRAQMQEVQVFLEVVEDVANQFLLIIAIDVIGLAAAAQENLGAVVVAVLIGGFLRLRVGKGGAQV